MNVWTSAMKNWRLSLTAGSVSCSSSAVASARKDWQVCRSSANLVSVKCSSWSFHNYRAVQTSMAMAAAHHTTVTVGEAVESYLHTALVPANVANSGLRFNLQSQN